jgi:pachytene checkpoint protein 2
MRSYSHARLLEVNSHSLFSKWFSESGKLVQKLFTNITDLADEDDAFLIVLIGDQACTSPRCRSNIL